MRAECSGCDCTFATGCKFETSDGGTKKRPYVMTKPRGRRGPYHTVERLKKRREAKRLAEQMKI